MSSNAHHRDLLDPPSLAGALTAAATQSALQDTRGAPSSSPNVDAAAVRAALAVCERTAALLRAQLNDSQGEADDVAPPAKRRRVVVERGDDDDGRPHSRAPAQLLTPAA